MVDTIIKLFFKIAWYAFFVLQGSIKDSSVFFRYSMWWRIFYGVLRLIFGAVLLQAVGSPFSALFYQIMGHELIKDPSDMLYVAVNFLLNHQHLYVTYFLAFYFIFWGILDIILSINLLKDKLWAFPLSLVLIALFVVYEIFRYFHTYSVILLAVIIIDTLVFWLIYVEYKRILPKSNIPQI